MYIRLQDTLINLDLIKEIDDVTAHHYQGKDIRVHSNEEYIDHKPMSSTTEAKTLARVATDDEYNYEVRYFIKVWYISERFAKFVNVGTNRRAAQKLHDEFAAFVNNNSPNIPHLKII